MRYLIKISLVFIAFLFWGATTKEVKLTEGIQPGFLAPGINLQGINLKGNGYVLLQFWAAYDPQSRVCNSQMHNVIASSAINVSLISISMDEDPSVFEGVIKTDHLDETTQFNDPEGVKSKLYERFRLQNGFGNWLIDSNGIIVAKNIRPEEIQSFIHR